jgi:transcriptional regulator with XRE-family HTH domain
MFKITWDKGDFDRKTLFENTEKGFSTINAYTCNRQQPSLKTLHQIAKILQMNVKDLLTNEKKEK